MDILKKTVGPLPLDVKTKWLEVPLLDGESDLIKAWKGLTPRGVAQKMAEEYLRRFPSPILPEDHIQTDSEDNVRVWCKWIALKHNTWAELEQKLKCAARVCRYREADLFYWDRMRFVFRKLPSLSARRINRSISRALEKHNLEHANPIEEMYVCRLCWRAAPKRRGEAWAYCHLSSPGFAGHELSKEHNKRRRAQHSRLLRPHSLPIFTDKDDPLFSQLKPSRVVTVTRQQATETDNSVKLTLDRLWLFCPASIIRHLPHVCEYLVSRNANMKNTRSIIDTLEGPAPTIQSEEEKTAREWFYDACVFHYYMYLPHLIWAEIWLRYEAEQKKHGGARKGAGRPKKAIATATKSLPESAEK